MQILNVFLFITLTLSSLINKIKQNHVLNRSKIEHLIIFNSCAKTLGYTYNEMDEV